MGAVLTSRHTKVGQEVVDLHVDVEQVRLEASQVNHGALQKMKTRIYLHDSRNYVLCVDLHNTRKMFRVFCDANG